MCARYEKFHTGNFPARIYCQQELAFHAAQYGDWSEAAKHSALLVRHLPNDRDADVQIARGYALLYRQDYDTALPVLYTALEQLPTLEVPAWWGEVLAANAHLAIGVGELARGNPQVAVRVLEQALPVYERRSETHPHPGYARRLAWSWSALARAMLASHPANTVRSHQRACELLLLAERWYREAGEDYQWSVLELARWAQDCHEK